MQPIAIFWLAEEALPRTVFHLCSVLDQSTGFNLQRFKRVERNRGLVK